MEEAASFFGRNARRADFLSLARQVFEPEIVLGAEIVFELAAETLREGGAGAAGGDSNLEFTAANDRGVVEVAKVGDVDNVAENGLTVGFAKDPVVK